MPVLMPRKVKHRKWQKGRTKGVAQKGFYLAFGSFGLKALEAKWITARQIEAARRAITRYIQREGKVWIRIFPDKPVTSKGAEVGMGGGKGTVDHFVVPIKPGKIMFEMDGVSEQIAKQALAKAAHKLPVKTIFIARR